MAGKLAAAAATGTIAVVLAGITVACVVDDAIDLVKRAAGWIRDRLGITDDDDETDDSEQQSVSVPGTVSDLSPVAGDGQIAVSWSDSVTTAADGFGYRVQWKIAAQTWDQSTAADQFEDLEHGDDLATSYVITRLSNGSVYGVRVAAFNAQGFSDWIDTTATPEASKPVVSAGSLDCANSDVIVAEASVAEPQYWFSYLEFTITLCELNLGAVYIDYHMEHITTDDDDLGLWQGTLVFDPFNREKKIKVQVKADNKTEGDETVALVLGDTHGTAMSIGPGRVLGTITDRQ